MQDKLPVTFDEASRLCQSKRQRLVCSDAVEDGRHEPKNVRLQKSKVAAVDWAVPRICLCKSFVACRDYQCFWAQYKLMDFRFRRALIVYRTSWFWFPVCLSLLSVPWWHLTFVCTVPLWNSSSSQLWTCLCFCFALSCWSLMLLFIPSLLAYVSAAEKQTFTCLSRQAFPL